MNVLRAKELGNTELVSGVARGLDTSFCGAAICNSVEDNYVAAYPVKGPGGAGTPDQRSGFNSGETAGYPGGYPAAIENVGLAIRTRAW
jgi:hypothetical protein